MMSSDPGLARLVERQMRNWELARAQRVKEGRAAAHGVQPFVTLSRVVGSGGGRVARLLAGDLRWPIFDRAILQAMAGDDELRSRLYRSLDERDLGWFEETLRCLTEGYSRNDYFHRLTQTVLSLARQGPGVYLGRAADLILPESAGLRVRLVASEERCVRGYARDHHLDLEDARRERARIERQRAEFIWNHFHVDAAAALRHDLIVNLDRWSERQGVDLIMSALRLRGIIAPAGIWERGA